MWTREHVLEVSDLLLIIRLLCWGFRFRGSVDALVESFGGLQLLRGECA